MAQTYRSWIQETRPVVRCRGFDHGRREGWVRSQGLVRNVISIAALSEQRSTLMMKKDGKRTGWGEVGIGSTARDVLEAMLSG